MFIYNTFELKKIFAAVKAKKVIRRKLALVGAIWYADVKIFLFF